MSLLSKPQLQEVVSSLAQTLDELQIDYAIMGGAVACLLGNNPARATSDVDLVVHVDERMITADRLTSELLAKYPSQFAPISQFGHTIPAYKLPLPDGGYQLVELEIFDLQSWPQRPQYDIKKATRRTITVGGHPVKLFGPEWILREKILSQFQRQGTPKEASDIVDLTTMLHLAVPGRPELDFNHDQRLVDALSNLLQKEPELEPSLKQKINCTAVFSNE